jgi:glycosyltransferase involved in cell wall biosynthesis
MTIAINLSQITKAGNGEIFYDYLLKIALSEPDHQFIFITPAANDNRSITSKNITQVIAAPRANNPLMWRIWLDYTLPRIAGKYKAEIIIHTGGVCSLRTKIRQYIFVNSLPVQTPAHFFSKKEMQFLKKNMPAFLNKATAIVTTSDFLMEEITQRYSIGKEKIKRIHLMPGDDFQILDWKEKEAIKELYTEGKEYFIFSGEIHPGINLVNLLKAFSFFKKRQKSNMQLIIAAQSFPAKDPFIENFKTYKYRKEVKLLLDQPQKDLAKMIAAAYAFLYPSMYEDAPLSPLQAMQCGVPVITSNAGAINEICGDAALYADPLNVEDIANKMMLVFKDEAYRAEMIKSGQLRIQKINKDSLANQWWKTMPGTAG